VILCEKRNLIVAQLLHVVHLLFSPLYSRQKIPACRESAYGKDEEIPYLAMRPAIRACFAKE
jgi:hypothetical protein